MVHFMWNLLIFNFKAIFHKTKNLVVMFQSILVPVHCWLPSQHWTERAKIVRWYSAQLKSRLPGKCQTAGFPAKVFLCALGQHRASNFLVQCCLRRIWKPLTRQYSCTMLNQHGHYNIVWAIFLIKVFF